MDPTVISQPFLKYGSYQRITTCHHSIFGVMSKYQHKKHEIGDNDCSKCYIGSTCESLVKGMGRRKRAYTQYLINEQNKHFPHLVLLFDAFGIDNCKSELVEECPT